MSKKSLVIALTLTCMFILGSGKAYARDSLCEGPWGTPCKAPTATLLAPALDGGGSGSAIGPDGALYVAEPGAGQIWSVDPKTGVRTLFASGLPTQIADVGIGGVMDVAFIDASAYALVTLVSSDVGGSDTVGIYRVDGPDSYTVVADIGLFSTQNPPKTPFDVPSGVQYALQPYRGGFLVTDGHHNRVLQVALDGLVSELIAFENIVPTGLAVRGNWVYMAEAGPVPHLPENGKVVWFEPKSPSATSVAATDVATGARLLVDVEFGRDHTLYALAQGNWDGAGPGSPAQPSTGALVKANRDGIFITITDGLDRPTSLEFIGNTAYVVTLTGEIWKIDGVAGLHHGQGR